MKAHQIIEETDPQGTIMGVLGMANLQARSRQLSGCIRRTSQFLRYAGLAVIATVLMFACTQMPENAFSLHESGPFSGTGYQEISARGPLCGITLSQGNVSLFEVGKGTVWRVLQNSSLREEVSSMRDLNQHDPKELLASGHVESGPLFEKGLADRDHLQGVIATKRAEKAATPGGLGNVP
jgi:hypothetical protein